MGYCTGAEEGDAREEAERSHDGRRQGTTGLQASSLEGKAGRILVRDRIRQLSDHLPIRER